LWSPSAWTTGQSGRDQRTPDLKALIKVVVDRPGRTSGNALALIIMTGSGHRTLSPTRAAPPLPRCCMSTTNSCLRTLLAVDLGAYAPPRPRAARIETQGR